jgi:glycyl-tRNA synthetase beta chain
VADAAFERGDYTASLQALAALKAPVDAFFDGVMVNAEDPACAPTAWPCWAACTAR